jgi:hypothetical protein
MEDMMPFGKHKGTKVRVLLYSDIAYIKWAIENGALELDNVAFKKYEELLMNADGDL